MQIGNRVFDTANHTYIMGILNVTPDSFSDGGRWDGLDRALRHTERMLAEGADIIDIGGESTRPGHTQIPDDEEIDRVAPVIAAVRARFDAPISVDTYKSAVARTALDAGADLINDIWGFRYDPAMAALVAERGAACCLMHNREDRTYSDFWPDLRRELAECAAIAVRAGVPADRILLDPGVGFAKTHGQNLACIGRLGELRDLGYPLLLGCSRKGVIGKTLDLPVDQRVEGTLATTVAAALQGAAFVRVHDIEANRRAIRMAEAIRQAQSGEEVL